MTKLMQWLSALALYLSIWIALLLDYFPSSYEVKQIVFFSPIILLVAFACFSIGTIAYRVATFNDCEQASKELQQEIKEAQADLKKKGIVS